LVLARFVNGSSLEVSLSALLALVSSVSGITAASISCSSGFYFGAEVLLLGSSDKLKASSSGVTLCSPITIAELVLARL
jgi:ABC-type microcin C transport system permease subunit YejE